MAQKIILDVDTGGDDAVAILLAGHHPRIELVAVTVCHGNGPLELTLDNTLRVLQAGHLEKTPVYAGSECPLIGDLIQTHPIQKSTLPLPPAGITPTAGRAVDFIVDYYLGPGGPETIYAPIGPQTNLALALRLEPAIAERVPRIVTMAGAFTEGNTTPSAEFNILADPEACPHCVQLRHTHYDGWAGGDLQSACQPGRCRPAREDKYPPGPGCLRHHPG